MEGDGMGSVIFSMGMSLDGYIAARDGAIDWNAPDEELHGFHNEQTRALGAHLLGRRLYETMVYWETADRDPSLGRVEREFAAIWQALPKVVFSRTLDAVEGRTRLATGTIADEVARLRSASGGDIGVGGAGLAAECARLGLLDEYRLFVSPVLLGAGTPYFPALESRVAFELVESRTFGGRVVYLRYRRA
jgi:dihydrofolate reductase